MNSLAETLRSLGPPRLAMMGAIAAGVIAFFIYLTSRLATPDLALLYADLDPRDSGQIVSRLEQMEVRYRLSQGGGQIFVPSDKVARMRVAMAEEGLPSGGSVGYEIFDRSEGLGTTNFVQNINHLRALEGELARTIRSIGSVHNARVHLVLPQRELFTRDRQEPSASIVVELRGKHRFDRAQVLAIQHLVAAAVPALRPGKVSIIDHRGSLLARGTSEGDAQGVASTAEEMRVAFETRMVRTIEELLERSLGPGNVRAQVAAEMDFDRVTENAEIFDPEGQVVRSTQTVEEESGSLDGDGLAPVSIAGNLPDANLGFDGASKSQSSTTRNEETVNYEISRTVRTHVRETGAVRRLSVAVMINGTTTELADGQTAYQPRVPEEMEQFAALVRSAVGLDEERGDVLEIVNLQFADLGQDLEGSATGMWFGLYQVQFARIAEVLVLGVVAALVLLLVVRPLIGRVIEGGVERDPRRLTDQRASAPALVAPNSREAAPEGAGKGNAEVVADEIEQMIDLNKVEGRVRASSVRKIGEIVDKHPDEAVGIIRSWLYQQG